MKIGLRVVAIALGLGLSISSFQNCARGFRVDDGADPELFAGSSGAADPGVTPPPSNPPIATDSPGALPSPQPSPSPSPPPPPSSEFRFGCADAAVCETFESPLSADTWTSATPDCSGSGKVALDTTQSHSGLSSLRVSGGGGYCDHAFLRYAKLSAVGSKIHARFYVRLEKPLTDSHVTFLSMTDANDQGRDFRMGGQSRTLMFNRELSDATLPELSPSGIALSASIPAGTWTCIEFEIDQGARTLSTRVNDKLVAGLAIDKVPTAEIDRQWLSATPWAPDLKDFNIGWESYSGAPNTIWFDDVVISKNPIGCGGNSGT